MAKKLLIYTQEHIIGQAGGAEKVFVNMVNAFVDKGYEVLAVCNSPRVGEPFFSIDNRVKFINLYNENFDDIQIKQPKTNHFEEFLYKNFLDKEAFEESRKFSDKFEKLLEIERPDAIICHFMYLYRQISYCKDYDIPTIIMMHSYPDIFFNKFGKKYFPINRLVLNKADLCQVLFPSHIKSLEKYYFGKIKPIADAVDTVNDEAAANLNEGKNIILTVSRFDKSKRQDILIEAFSLIADKYPDWQVHLYGQFDPPELFDYIKSLIKNYNLENQVKYMGVTNKPFEVMKNSDIFVLPSDFEGFSIATAEAMSVGLPCVGFKDCNGLNDLILDNKTGLLTENTSQDLAKNIEILINDKDLRIKLGRNSKERIKEFSPDIIWVEWEKAVFEAINLHKSNKTKKKISLFWLYVLTFLKAVFKNSQKI